MAPRRDGLVSVIIPAYNAAPYIREALQSVLDQTYPYLEVLVVDDGSTDRTGEIVGDVAATDHRVCLIRQTNQGVGAARNLAIERATGAYIAPMDADDRWSPSKLERQVACMEERGPATGLVYCWYRSMNEEGDVSGYSQPHAIEGRISRAILLRNLVGNASVPLFRSVTLERVGGYVSRSEQGGAQGFEDWDLTLRVAEQFDVGVVQEYLVDYRQTQQCMSANAQAMANSFNVMIRRARERNPGVPEHEFRWSTANFYYYITRRSFIRNRYTEALTCLTKAVLADPLLLLNVHVYAMAVRSLFYTLSRGRFTPSKRKAAARSGDIPARTPKYTASPIGQRTFGRIQTRRLSAILADIKGSCI